MKTKILWITRTALFIALLIAAQALTVPLGNQFITGSAVNLILIIATMTCGLGSGVIVAGVSPVFAKIIGIGPLWTLIPFIMLGNIVLAVFWSLIGHFKWLREKEMAYPCALILAAFAKFIVLYIGVTRIALPLFTALPEPQAAAVSAMFSTPQLFTALIGGAFAAVILPMLKKAIR
ncbi:MAG: ECF transporter S component [Clostridiales bacterium]|jgi:hypothetical protein|nr:ECF transporter S component [Clostridiales bacterium]